MVQGHIKISHTEQHIGRLLTGLVILLLFVVLPLHAGQSASILIISSSPSPVYNEVKKSLIDRLSTACSGDGCNEYSFTSLLSGDKAPETDYRLVITLGQHAAHEANSKFHAYPMLNAMIPGEPDKSLPTEIDQTATSRIFLNQPVARYLRLIKHTLPQALRIGVITSLPDSQAIKDFELTATELGLTPIVAPVKDDMEVGKALRSVLDKIDVLLALPDATVHNNQTVSNILLTTYRNGVPLIGFSAAYLKAGAYAVVYSSPVEIGRHIGELAEQILRQDRLPLTQYYPKYFTAEINAKVARSLGAPHYSEQELKIRLEDGKRE